mmetsp:Transcript_42050/g.48769  ORF Transcript_42050/g.48769 Transcript_42050/m.48769 type:complete len:204 (-) Transcript_42050:2298-2909(-)
MAKNGGVIYAGSGSEYTDTGSTFKENAASSGGAVYFSDTTVSFTNTVLIYNYAKDGGALLAESTSTIQTFSNVNCSYNYVTESGGCLNLIGSSKIAISSSTFTYNNAEQTSSAIYFLGTDPSSIQSSSFSNNYAKEGNTISLLFAPTTLTSITILNNKADADSAGVFINFSTVVITLSTFNTTIFPNSEATVKLAAEATRVTG